MSLTPTALAPRPSSSASLRPSSSGPLRPPTASYVRPSSSLGTTSRPLSRVSQRSGSRLSQRPSLKQVSKIAPLTQALVTQIAGISQSNDADNFRIATDYVNKNLEISIGGSSGETVAKMDQHFYGLAKKARIQSFDVLADAIDATYKKLKDQTQKNVDLDAEIKFSRLPDHLQLLMLLSLPPNSSTLDFAEKCLATVKNPPTAPSTSLTWREILAEEPFEGEHWEGFQYGPTVEDLNSPSGGSTPSLSPWDDDSDYLREDSLSLAGSSPRSLSEGIDGLMDNSEPNFPPMKADHYPYSHRDAFEQLKAVQYWRTEWRINADVSRPFSLAIHSTLGPSIHRTLGDQLTLRFDGPNNERYINEHDAIRDILMGLQNCENALLILKNSTLYEPSLLPRIMHLTTACQLSILSNFASTATVLHQLRRFVASFLDKIMERSRSEENATRVLKSCRNPRTLEAFADAVDSEIRSFDIWCSVRDEAICKARAGLGHPLVVSFLSLDKSIRDKFSSSFVALKDILHEVRRIASTRRWLHTTKAPGDGEVQIWSLSEIQDYVQPSIISSILLNTVLHAVQEYHSMGDIVTSNCLMRVLVKSTEPVWSMVGLWLRNGMPMTSIAAASLAKPVCGDIGTVDSEFFVEDNGLGFLDPDFWAEGYTLRDRQSRESVNVDSMLENLPVFICNVAADVLGAGKAVGLLRAMGSEDEAGSMTTWMDKWKSFESLVWIHDKSSQIVATSIEELARLVHDELNPQFVAAQTMLTKVLIEDCDLWQHVHAIEDCYLMRRGDTMSHFLDKLFPKMDSRQTWADFHFLNTAFRDAVEAEPKKWIDPSLVRLSYRVNRENAVMRTIKGIEPLLVEYAVHFPLTYIFGPRTIQVYSSIFVWLVQMRRAQRALESILLRGAEGVHGQSDLKAFYAMRSKLSWFVNTLLNYVCTYVIHVEVLRFHTKLKKAKSFDEMISLHEDHLETMQSRCLLLPNTSAIHRAILSILDVCLHFTEFFVAFAGDATHDLSSFSMFQMKRHRSKRLNRQRRDVVGFSNSLRELETISDSDTDSDSDEIDAGPPDPSFSYSASNTISFDQDNVLSQVDKMSIELDSLVRFVRRGVENLSGGSGDVALTFGILAFNLEDWDRG